MDQEVLELHHHQVDITQDNRVVQDHPALQVLQGNQAHPEVTIRGNLALQALPVVQVCIMNLTISKLFLLH